MIARFPQVLGYSLEENLKPTVQWLRDLGLSKAEVAKVIARFPQVLSCSIDENLKPTVRWLRDLGLSKAEVAKVVGRHPPVLGYSIEENLKPTVRWLRDLGLSKAEVAKVIARFPQVLAYSLEENMKPTVRFLRDRGLSRGEISKVIVSWPPIVALSIENNLKPKVRQLLKWFSFEHVRALFVRNPCMFGLSLTRWLRRSEVLKQCNKLSVFGSAVMLTDAVFAERYMSKQEQLVEKGKLGKPQLLDFGFARSSHARMSNCVMQSTALVCQVKSWGLQGQGC